MDPSLLILLAEDEALLALTLQDSLEQAGFAIDHVSGAAAAIESLDANHQEISGLVTDIKLGGRVDGWAVARHARELIPHVPVVYMSGDSAHEHTAKGVPDSIMLQKPFVPAQLITAISTLLNTMPPQQPE